MSAQKKIIIDEDWKSQVQAEKEQAAEAKHPAPPEAKSEEAAAADPPMPPASFELLLTTLATEALVALGQVPHPVSGKPQLLRNQATYLIDTLDVLREKTKSNLSASEDQLLDNLLHQLRMAFVQIAGDSAEVAEAPKS